MLMQIDSANQLSHTTDFVINNLRYFAFKNKYVLVKWMLCEIKGYTEGG